MRWSVGPQHKRNKMLRDELVYQPNASTRVHLRCFSSVRMFVTGPLPVGSLNVEVAVKRAELIMLPRIVPVEVVAA